MVIILLVFYVYYIIVYLMVIILLVTCRNPSLRFTTKARGCKVVSQEGDPGVTSHAPGNAKSVRE